MDNVRTTWVTFKIGSGVGGGERDGAFFFLMGEVDGVRQ